MDTYYKKARLLLVCPINNTENDFMLHLKLDDITDTTGAILTQHIRTIDLKARPVVFNESASTDLIDKVKKRINLFF